MNDVVASRQLVKACNRFSLFELFLCCLSVFAGRCFPKGNQHKFNGVIFNSSAERTRKHADRILRKFRRTHRKVMRLEVLGLKIIGKLLGILFCSRHHNAGVTRSHCRPKVIFKKRQRSVPAGALLCIDRDKLFHGNIKASSCKVVNENRTL